MIVTLQCQFGVPLDLSQGDRFGSRVEAEAIEFINAAPIDWSISWGLMEGDPRPGLRKGYRYLEAFHDLQRPVAGGTRGTPIAKAVLETRGIGDATVMIWLRYGTYPEPRSCA